MRYINCFAVRGKWTLGLLLLILSRPVADSGNITNYPDRVRCLVDTYLMSFPMVTKSFVNLDDHRWSDFHSQHRHRFCHPLWWEYGSQCYYYFKIEDSIRTNIQVMSIERFLVEPEQRRDSEFQVEIWVMKTSAEANSLIELLSACGQITSFLEKFPKRFFVYENFFVLVTAGSFNTLGVVIDRTNEIIQSCFK